MKVGVYLEHKAQGSYKVCSNMLQGWWYEVDEADNENFLKSLKPSPLPKLTTLKDFFSRELEVMGIDQNGDTIFKMGVQSDLFGTTFFYEPVLILDENRVFKMYGDNCGRDYFYIKGKWK